MYGAKHWLGGGCLAVRGPVELAAPGRARRLLNLAWVVAGLLAVSCADSEPTPPAPPAGAAAGQQAAATGIHVLERADQAPGWAVRYGEEFWRSDGSAVLSTFELADSAGLRVSPDLDLAAVVSRVSHAFRREAPGERPAVWAGSYRAEVTAAGLRFSPHRRADEAERRLGWVGGPIPDPETVVTFHTRSVSRGSTSLYRSGARALSWAVLGDTAQAQLSATHALVEHYWAGPRGVEVSWVLGQPPSGSGNLAIQAELSGLELVGRSPAGLHYGGKDGIARVRVGSAILVDASGQRWDVAMTPRDGGLELVVAAQALEEAAYPIAIDPDIQAELDMDDAVSTNHLAQFQPVIGYHAGTDTYLVVWTDSFGNLRGMLWSGVGGLPVLSPLLLAHTPATQLNPAIATTADGFLLVWEQGTTFFTCNDDAFLTLGEIDTPTPVRSGPGKCSPSTNGGDIVAAQVIPTGDGSGAEVGPVFGVATEPEVAQRHPAVACIEGSTCLVTWTDDRNGSDFGWDIYAAVVDPATGAVLPAPVDPPAYALPVANVARHQVSSSVAAVADTFLVAWEDFTVPADPDRGGDVMAARVSAEGDVLDVGPDAIVIDGTVWDAGSPDVGAGPGRFLVAWSYEDPGPLPQFVNAGEVRPIAATRVDLDGGAGPVTFDLGGAPFAAYSPQVAFATDPAVNLVAWEQRGPLFDNMVDRREGGAEMVQTSDTGGSLPSGAQCLPRITVAPGEEVTVSQIGVYTANDEAVELSFYVLDADGNPVYPPEGADPLAFTYEAGEAWRDSPVIDGGWTLSGGTEGQSYYVGARCFNCSVFWYAESEATGADTDWGEVVSGDGESAVSGDEYEPGIYPFECSLRLYDAHDADIWGATVDEGDAYTLAMRLAGSQNAEQVQPEVTSDGAGFAAAWSDDRGVPPGVDRSLSTFAEVYATTFALYGSTPVVEPGAEERMGTATNRQVDVVTAANDQGDFLVAWLDDRAAIGQRFGHTDIRGAVVSADGAVIDPQGLELGATAFLGDAAGGVPTFDRNPALAALGSDFLVVWDSWQGLTQNYDLAARRVLYDAGGYVPEVAIGPSGEDYRFIASSTFDETRARVAARPGATADDSEYLVVYSAGTITPVGLGTEVTDLDVVAQRADATGQPIDEPKALADESAGAAVTLFQTAPDVAWTGADYLVAYRSREPSASRIGRMATPADIEVVSVDTVDPAGPEVSAPVTLASEAIAGSDAYRPSVASAQTDAGAMVAVPILPLLIDTAPGVSSTTSLLAGSGCGSQVRVGAEDVPLAGLAMKLNVQSEPAVVTFVVFDHDTHDLLFAAEVSAVAGDAPTWLPTDADLVLAAHHSYDIGAIADVDTDWVYDRSAEQANGLSALPVTPVLSMGAGPELSGHDSYSCAVRLAGPFGIYHRRVALDDGYPTTVGPLEATALAASGTGSLYPHVELAARGSSYVAAMGLPVAGIPSPPANGLYYAMLAGDGTLLTPTPLEIDDNGLVPSIAVNPLGDALVTYSSLDDLAKLGAERAAGRVVLNEPPAAVEVAVDIPEDALDAPLSLAASDPDLDAFYFQFVREPADGELTLYEGGVCPSDVDCVAPAECIRSACQVPVTTTTVISPDADLRYTPESNSVAGESLAYVASDGFTTSAEAGASIAIVPANDPPELLPGATLEMDPLVDEGTAALVPPTVLAASDPDLPGDEIFYVLLTPPKHALLLLVDLDPATPDIPLGAGDVFTPADLASGRIEYDHNGDEPLSDPCVFGQGADQVLTSDCFTVALEDSAGVPAPGSPFVVRVDVNATNDPPTLLAAVLAEATEDVLFEHTVAWTDPDTVLTDDPDTPGVIEPVECVFAGGSETPPVTAPCLDVTLPTWLDWTNNGDGSLTLSGTPTNDEVGSHDVSVEVYDEPLSSAAVGISIEVVNVNDTPEFTSSPGVSVEQGELYTYDAAATDVDSGETPALEAVVKPGWLTFTDDGDGTGTLSGTPDNSQVGTYSITLAASDGNPVNGVAYQRFDLEVLNVNDAPTFDQAADLPIEATEDAAFSITFTASDVDPGDVPTLAAADAPDWLTATANPGGSLTLSGLPGNDDVGPHSLTLSLNDGHLVTSLERTYEISVINTNDTPFFVDPPVTEVDEDAAYSYAVVTDDVDVGDTLTITALGDLPDWLELTDNGGGTADLVSLAGRPDNGDVGSHLVVLQVSDGDPENGTAQQRFTIEVLNTNDAPTFTATPDTSITQEDPYLYTATAADDDVGDGAVVVANIVPDWLTATENRDGSLTLSGTPRNGDVGTHPVELQVGDGHPGDPVLQAFDIEVVDLPEPPFFTSEPVTEVLQDEAYTYVVTANDVDPSDHASISVETKPGWLSVSFEDDGSVILSGTPGNEHVGLHPTLLRVTDDNGAAVDQGFDIEVVNVNDAPTFTTGDPPLSVDEDALYSYTVEVADIDAGDSLELAATLVPDWLAFDVNEDGTATLEGVPANEHVGSHDVVLTVTDGEATVDQAFTIVVNNTNDAPTFQSDPPREVDEDALYHYEIATADVDAGDVLEITAVGDLPSWLDLTDDGDGTGLLEGTPDNSQVGKHAVTLQVSDGEAAVEQAFVIDVGNTSDAPTFLTSAPTSVDEGALYTYEIEAQGDAGDTIRFSAGVALPSWLGLVDHNDGTATLSGTPGNDDVGEHPVTLTVANDLGDSTDQLFTIAVANTNDAPVVDLNGPDGDGVDFATTFVEDAGPLAIADADATLTDVDGIHAGVDTDLTSMTITLTDRPDGDAEVLAVDVSGTGLSAVYTGATGVLDITGTADLATYLNVLLDVTYDDTAQAPDESTRRVEVVVSDGELSGLAIVELAVEGRNDAPTIDLNGPDGEGVDAAITFTEDAGPVAVAADTAVIEDAEGDGLESLTLAFVDGDGEGIAPPDGALEVLAADSAGTLIEVAYDADTGILELAGADSLDRYVKVLRRVTYENRADTPNTAGRRLQVVADDGTDASVAVVAAITVVASNDAPVADAIEVTTAEDTAVVVTLTGSDVEGDGLSFAIAGDPAHGALSALDADAGTVTYTPSGDFNGTDAFEYVANDGQDDSEAASVTIEVTAANDPPVLVDPTPSEPVIGLEGQVVAFTVAATDPDGDVLTYGADGLPGTARLDRASGAFSWTPTYEDAGLTEIEVWASDGRAAATRLVQIQVDFIDEDGDTLPDTWEDDVGLGDSADSDEDTILDVDELDALGRPVDSDGDTILDANDSDSDNDTISDAHEAGDDDLDTLPIDSDGDGVADFRDRDSDDDGVFDIDEAGDGDLATPPIDSDDDGTADYLDDDSDDDDVLDGLDNCRIVPNADQLDADGDGKGDACDGDVDGDTVVDDVDNCETTPNTDQLDSDDDGSGDACDGDDDNDEVEDLVDMCPFEPGVPYYAGCPEEVIGEGGIRDAGPAVGAEVGDDGDKGCGCSWVAEGGGGASPGGLALLLAALGLLCLRRRRTRSTTNRHASG